MPGLSPELFLQPGRCLALGGMLSSDKGIFCGTHLRSLCRAPELCGQFVGVLMRMVIEGPWRVPGRGCCSAVRAQKQLHLGSVRLHHGALSSYSPCRVLVLIFSACAPSGSSSVSLWSWYRLSEPPLQGEELGPSAGDSSHVGRWL